MATRFKAIRLSTGYENGLNGSNIDTSPDWLFEAKNIYYHPGFVAKEPGESKYNATALTGSPKILSGVEYSPDQANYRIIVHTSDGKLYKDSGTGTFPVTLASGLVVTKPAIFVEGGKEGAALNRKLFIFTEANQVKVLSGDGSTISNISLPPVDWTSSFPSSGFIFEGRLCGFGNSNDPHRLYFSTTTNHEDFVGTGSFNISVFPGEGLGLTAAIPVNRGVVLFKYPRGIYFLDATSPTTSNWRVYKLSSSFGCPSQRCAVSYGGDIFFLDSSGLPYLLSINEAEGTKITQIFDDKNKLDELILRNLKISTILTDWQIYIDKRFFGGELNIIDGEKRITIDLALGKARVRMTNRLPIFCGFETFFSSGKRGGIMLGDNAGTVWKGDIDKYSKGGTLYDFHFLTSSTDIDESVSGKRKIGGAIEIRYVSNAVNISFNVTVYFDGEPITLKTISRTLSQVYYYDGGATYDSGATYSGRINIASDMIKVFGTGKRVALEIKETSDSLFGIVDAIMYLDLGDERVG